MELAPGASFRYRGQKLLHKICFANSNMSTNPPQLQMKRLRVFLHRLIQDSVYAASLSRNIILDVH